MHRYPASLPLLAGVLALFSVRRARAADPECAPPLIEVAPDVSARWPGLLHQLHEAFHARDDIDPCAGIRLMSQGGSVAVQVTLLDGRSAMRIASRLEDIVPTLESLLLVPQRTNQARPSAIEPSRRKPPPAEAALAIPSAPSVRTESSPSTLGLIDQEGDASEPALIRRRRRLRIELSVVTGGRIGDGQTGVGLGAFSFLELSGWLVGFEGRVDRYRSISIAPTDGGALELALLGGRRFWVHNLALDLTAGPAAAVQGTATFASRSTTTGEAVTKSSSSTVPRLLLGARMGISALSTVHPFVGIDGELGPSRATTDVPGASRLPVWTIGLALGATVGTK